MRYPILLALMFALLAGCSTAQTMPSADVAVGYSPLYILKGYTIWMNGGRSSVAVNANNWFSVAGDFGAYVGHVPQIFTGETPTWSARDLPTADCRGTCHSCRLCSGDRISRHRQGVSQAGETSSRLPWAVGPTLGSAAARNSRCGWKASTLVSVRAAPPHRQCGCRQGSSTGLEESSLT